MKLSRSIVKMLGYSVQLHPSSLKLEAEIKKEKSMITLMKYELTPAADGRARERQYLAPLPARINSI